MKIPKTDEVVDYTPLQRTYYEVHYIAKGSGRLPSGSRVCFKQVQTRDNLNLQRKARKTVSSPLALLYVAFAISSLSLLGEKMHETFKKALVLKEQTISSLAEQINELNDIIKQQEFMIARRDIIIRFLVTGKADTQGEPIVKD